MNNVKWVKLCIENIKYINLYLWCRKFNYRIYNIVIIVFSSKKLIKYEYNEINCFLVFYMFIMGVCIVKIISNKLVIYIYVFIF